MYPCTRRRYHGIALHACTLRYSSTLEYWYSGTRVSMAQVLWSAGSSPHATAQWMDRGQRGHLQARHVSPWSCCGACYLELHLVGQASVVSRLLLTAGRASGRHRSCYYRHQCCRPPPRPQPPSRPRQDHLPARTTPRSNWLSSLRHFPDGCGMHGYDKLGQEHGRPCEQRVQECATLARTLTLTHPNPTPRLLA